MPISAISLLAPTVRELEQLATCVHVRSAHARLATCAHEAHAPYAHAQAFFTDLEDAAERLDLSVAILLTAVAFKYATAAYLPQISYLTLVDKLILLCAAVIILSTLLQALLGMLRNWADCEQRTLDMVNAICFITVCIAWLAVHVWYVRAAHVARHSDSFAGQKREAALRQRLHGAGHDEYEENDAENALQPNWSFIDTNEFSFTRTIRRSSLYGGIRRLTERSRMPAGEKGSSSSRPSSRPSARPSSLVDFLSRSSPADEVGVQTHAAVVMPPQGANTGV